MLQRRYVLFFLFMILPIMHHVVLLPLIWDIAGRDAWLSVFISAPIGFFIGYITWKLMSLDSHTNLPRLSEKLFGPVIGTFLNIIWLLYFLFLGSTTISSLMNLLHTGFYQYTPMWFLGSFFMIFVVYSLSKGIKVIAWTSALLTFTILISGHVISGMLMPEREYRHLLPVLEFGWTPVFAGIILYCSIWAEVLSMAILTVKNVKSKGMLSIFFLAIGANIVMMITTNTGILTVFGMEQADNLEHPAFSAVRMVGLGFIDRFDIYGLALMTFGCFIRTAFFLYATIECLRKKLSSKYPTVTLFLVASIFLFLSLLIFQNSFFFKDFIKYYVYTFVMILLPFIYIATYRIKNTVRGQGSKGTVQNQ